MNKRIILSLVFLSLFIWCLYLPAYDTLSTENASLSSTNMIDGFYSVEALIIYAWLPCLAMIGLCLTKIISGLNEEKNISPNWLISVIHVGSIVYTIVDMIIHNFHYAQTPLISGYLILMLTTVSYIEHKKYKPI